ncbi:hypothetical protein FPRO06_13745 [Fusarium proliferatum]|nr:hypothetical protein FPRO06_13745 [Fusarium proliferatum]
MEPGLKRHVCQPIIHGPNGLLEKSPESTLTVEKLLEIDSKPPAPDPSEMNVPKFSFCSDCYAKWVYGEVMAPNATFSFHFKFRNLEAEVEASMSQLSDIICADIDKWDVIATDDPESSNWDLVMAQLRR